MVGFGCIPRCMQHQASSLLHLSTPARGSAGVCCVCMHIGSTWLRRSTKLSAALGCTGADAALMLQSSSWWGSLQGVMQSHPYGMQNAA
jgi:hypothetical protein